MSATRSSLRVYVGVCARARKRNRGRAPHIFTVHGTEFIGPVLTCWVYFPQLHCLTSLPAKGVTCTSAVDVDASWSRFFQNMTSGVAKQRKEKKKHTFSHSRTDLIWFLERLTRPAVSCCETTRTRLTICFPAQPSVCEAF
jgi:hypothetical protein